MNSITSHFKSAFQTPFSWSELLVEEEWYGFTPSPQQKDVWLACHRVGKQTNLYLLTFSGKLPEPILPGNFFGQSGHNYQLSAPIWTPNGQQIAFAVESKHKPDCGIWLLNYTDKFVKQIYRGKVKFPTGDFQEFTQHRINEASSPIVFSEDNNSLLFLSNDETATSDINDCLGKPQHYPMLLCVAIKQSTVETKCYVKGGRIESFTPLDSSARCLAVGINWGQWSEVYVIEETPLQINSPSNSPLDNDAIYAPIRVAWDKNDESLPLLVRCNNTGFAKWHRFPYQVGQLSHSQAKQINPGNFDDTQLLVQPEGYLLASNEVGLGRETIWLIDRIGQKQPVTKEQNALETPIVKVGSEVFLCEEKAFQPPILVKVNLEFDSRTNLAVCSHHRGSSLLELKEFSTEDRLCPYVQIYLPNTEPPQEGFPGIVWIKGGPISNLSRYYDYNSIELLVKQGFAVASVNYRASSGQGVAHMAAGLAENLGIADRDDVIHAAKLLADHPSVNKDKLGAWGYSWGGYLILQIAILQQHPFKCLCGGGIISNWEIQQTQTEVRYYDHRLVGGYVKDFAKRAKEQSPVHKFTPDQVKIPVLLFQGEKDIDTPVEQAYELQKRIDSQHGWEQPIKLNILPGEGHDFSQVALLQYWQESVQFFTRYLKPWNFVDNPSASQSLY
ncbi:prolyl oligopeptidase family serine peptidase [Candidatus Parabeggiatoa sp. HSG14]|uniref:S9 family peptidase n=1 Tax=Candidatus Parabeggiatoa sp. HSG14 TaxID=3055593 RepID=UPI0025A8B4F8|nr:prolyl oligopeptidase family serine peptidase [Thiotrichales bacterium HSG14]